MGFVGTVSKGGAQAAGLATLSDDEYGGGPKALKNGNNPETPDGEGELG